MSKLDVTKKHYSKLKAMSKITNILSEIRTRSVFGDTRLLCCVGVIQQALPLSLCRN